MIKQMLLVLVCLLFISCSAPYSDIEIANDFNIKSFSNQYIAQADNDEGLLDIFSDETLKSMVRVALTHNTDILIYKNRIDIAKSQLNIATSNQMPKLDSAISYKFNGESNINWNLMTSWELDIFGKYAQTTSANEELVNVAKANLVNAQISLISDIVIAYYNIKYLLNNIDLTKSRIDNYKEIVEVMQYMYGDGFIDFATFLDNKSLLQTEEQNLSNMQNNLEEQKNALKIMLNDMDYPINIKTDSLPNPILKLNLDNSVNILLNRPDIRAKISSLNAAVHNLNASKAKLYPNISLSGSLSQILLSPNGISKLAYDILSSIAMPIFSRKEIYEDIKISDYTRLEAYYSLKSALSLAVSEVENAIYAISSNKDVLAKSKEMLEQNIEILSTLESSKELGLVDIVEYLQAINNNLQIAKNTNTAYFNTITSTIYLYRAVGGNAKDLQ